MPAGAAGPLPSGRAAIQRARTPKKRGAPAPQFSAALAQVRHEAVRNWGKCFQISLGDGRVCTTFEIQIEALGQYHSKLS